MYRKYILDRVDEQQPQDSSTFPDNHLIVGDAQSKAARAGAVHCRDSGTRVHESGNYRSDRSDSGIESELGGSYSKSSSGQGAASEPGAAYGKVTDAQSKGDFRVELKNHREWAPYKKPYRVKSEPALLKSKPVKQKKDSSVQCDLEPSGRAPPQVHDKEPPAVADWRNLGSAHSVSGISRLSSFSDGYISSKVEVKPLRRSPNDNYDIDLFDDFASRDYIPEFRRPPSEIPVTDAKGGATQKAGYPAARNDRTGESRASSSPPLRLWDAHGCHNVKQEVIVARPIADAAANGKLRSPVGFLDYRSEGLSRRLLETTHSLQGHPGHPNAQWKEVIRVLPAQESGHTTRNSSMVSMHAAGDARDPKKLSPRYSKHLQGESPWPQAANKTRLIESSYQSKLPSIDRNMYKKRVRLKAPEMENQTVEKTDNDRNHREIWPDYLTFYKLFIWAKWK